MAQDSTIAIVTATDLQVAYNDLVVLNRASLSIHEGDRLGMVGRNGAGKSTFLKILTNEMEPDAGSVTRKRDLITGYLSQNFSLDTTKTVYENIREGAKHVLDLIHEFETLPGHSHRHEYLEQRIQILDGWTLDTRIAQAMDHLHTPDGDRSIVGLSGGEQRRVAMARTVVGRPDFLILDEPTNHLDPDSVEWLEEFLSDFPGTFLLVTHDRHFLDSVCNGMAELANGQFYSYDGNYSDYLVAKSERQATEELVEHKRQMFLRRELEWVRRGPKAQTTKSKARWDRYDAVVAVDAPNVESDVELVLPPPPPLGNRIVELTNVGLQAGDKLLFEQFNFNFEAGMKIGVTGRNGMGKTSLLKAILGQMEPVSGSIKIGALTQFNYVDQGRMQLDDSKTVLEEVSDGSEFVIWGNGKLSLRAYLKRFLFTDDRITTRVRHLSGGERSRLLLARTLKKGGNFLILDEPTNDLDLNTLRVLEEALICFPGVVLVVSHDRYFLDRVCNGILAFEGDQRVTYHIGNYSYVVEKKKERAKALMVASRQNTPPAPKAVATPKAAPKRKLTWKDKTELESMEATIHKVEDEVKRIENLFAAPDFQKAYGAQTSALMAELAARKQEAAKLYTRWEELEEIRNESVG